MKYINQLNIVLVLVATAIVLYSFTETYWSGEESAVLEIERAAAPPPRQIDSRPMPPASNSGRSSGSLGVDPETGLPAAGSEEPASSDFAPLTRPGSAASPGSDDRTGRNPRIFSTSPSTTQGDGQSTPRWNSDRSTPPGAEGQTGPSDPVRIQQPARTPFGQTVFPGAESQKRQESQDPSPPPVRSSMPDQHRRR